MLGDLNEYYESFKGLPSNKPIVRNNIIEDAFTVYAFDKMYSRILNVDISPNNIGCVVNYIIAPPDGGIDIFIEREDGDEYYYDILQVKYRELAQQDIIECFAVMQRTISTYLANPQDVPINLREIISKSNFDKSFKSKCNFYVVHKGDLNYAKRLEKNESIITLNDLNVLGADKEIKSVPNEVLKSDGFNNFIAYSDNNEASSYICNINGYDLAKLNNKYVSTELGKNILFGQNLRDSLASRSKTFTFMKETIDSEPEKFWFYNNGITIITEDFNADLDREEETEKDSFELKNFSIINGAQTTSSLGEYLKLAEMNRDNESIEKLKKVFVLARILVVDIPRLKDSISIYNNTQNPITSRDMVSNRVEQIELRKKLLEGQKPNIYVEIRRGTELPAHIRLEKHQKTNNEILAQLAFAAFFSVPYKAKDKKKTLFNRDFTDESSTINEDYHSLFHLDENDRNLNGILHKKTKKEIDELLFIAHLYKEAKKHLKKYYADLISKQYKELEKANENNKDRIETFITSLQLQSAINNVCYFYCVTLYYELKNQFEKLPDGAFNYKEFYKTKSNYKTDLIKDFSSFFLVETINTVKKASSSSGNIGSWIRAKKSEQLFLNELQEKLMDPAFQTKFQDFESKFKS